MSKSNLHIFNDPQGFFTNKIVDFINALQLGENSYINTAPDCSNKKEGVVYSAMNSFLKTQQQFAYKRVLFHSYNYFNKDVIKKIKSGYPNQHTKFVWIFWSHEYYQLPEFFSQLYVGLSRRFYFRKLISFHVEHFLKFVKGQVNFPFYTGLASFKKTFRDIDLMASFLKGDYEIVMEDLENSQNAFVAYLSLADFSGIPIDFKKDKPGIMIGHSGSPILNHYEIVKQLSEMKLKNNIFIPLSYGKKAYIRLLIQELKKFDHLNISLQTDYLSKDEYYRKIDSVGYFILNSACQQALGNIVFFLWSGTKIFVQKNTSTYKTLSEESFFVYSIEEDLNANGLTPLTLEQKEHNHKLISRMISEENVKKTWLDVLNFGSSS